jgi:hypothetical protein
MIINEARAELKFSSLEPKKFIIINEARLQKFMIINEARPELKFSSLEPQKVIIMARA